MSACVESRPPGDANDNLLNARCSETLHQAMHLNVVCLVSLFVAAHSIARNEGKALDIAPETVKSLMSGMRPTLPEVSLIQASESEIRNSGSESPVAE